MEIPMWLTLFALTTQAAAPHEEVQAELFLFDGAGAVPETARASNPVDRLHLGARRRAG